MKTFIKSALWAGLGMLTLGLGMTASAKEPVKTAAVNVINQNTDGHYETRYETVLVEPAHYEERYDRGRMVSVYVPDRYESIARQVWVEDYPSFGSYFRFDFGRGHDRHDWHRDRHDWHSDRHDRHDSHDSHGHDSHGHRH